ncbi:MAG TPA: hypothetical protein VHU83_11945 [Bryobacteraceae bacterium]|nr:hypothetical protein [Bryobacteraceae bacterium]
MAKKTILELNSTTGTVQSGNPNDFKKAIPPVVAFVTHDVAPGTGGLVVDLGKPTKKRIEIRASEDGDLFIELED